MGTISRGTKAGTGTTDFGTGTTILASEVNTDFNALVNEVNGNLDANNLANNAVTTVKITDLNVTTGKIADNAVTTAKIIDLNVTTGKIEVDGAVNARQATASNGSLAFTTVETDIATAPSITTRGGRVLLFCSTILSCRITAVSSSATITIRWYRDSTEIQKLEFTLTQTGNGETVPCCIPMHEDVPAAGAYVYKVTAQCSALGGITTPAAGAQGSIRAIELA